MEVDEQHVSIQDEGDCFGCALSFLTVLLEFIDQTASIKEFNQFYKEEKFLLTLFKSNMKMFSGLIRDASRNAICKIILNDQDSFTKILKLVQTKIISIIEDKDIPQHMISSLIQEEIELLINLTKVTKQMKEEDKENEVAGQLYQQAQTVFYTVMNKAVECGPNSAPIAEQILGPCL